MSEEYTTKSQQILNVLLDLKWHSGAELKDITWRFSAALLTLRDAGYDIVRRRIDKTTFEYRLNSREPDISFEKKCCPTCGRAFPRDWSV